MDDDHEDLAAASSSADVNSSRDDCEGPLQVSPPEQPKADDDHEDLGAASASLLLMSILLVMVVRAPLKYPLQSKQRRTMTMRILQLLLLLLMSILLVMIVRGPHKYPLQSKQRQTMTLRILQLPVLLLMSILLVMIVRGP